MKGIQMDPESLADMHGSRYLSPGYGFMPGACGMFYIGPVFSIPAMVESGREQHMTLSRVAIWLRQAAEALAFILALSVLLPLLFGYVAGIPGGRVMALVSSTLILQANGAFAGVGLGMEPREILVIMTLVEPGAVLGILAVCDTFAMTSKRVRSFLETTEKRMQSYPRASTGLFRSSFSLHCQ